MNKLWNACRGKHVTLDVIKKFENIAANNASNTESLQVLEQELETILSEPLSYLDRKAWLLCRNAFRVKHSDVMKIRKPRIFLGLINHEHYPNFQVIPLLQFADIVSLCLPQFYDGRVDRISFDPRSEDFSDLLKKTPALFKPDYYWEPQICGTSMPPYGLQDAPFPTIGGLCHTFRGANMEALANYYDYITPISTPFSKLFQSSSTTAKVIDVPVGGNWGSFDTTIETSLEEKRDIDLVINFSASTNPEYLDYRKQVHELCKNFEQKYGAAFVIKFEYGVSKTQYFETMKRAKVVVNACSFNGPYNYRTFEVINSGAILMQIKTQYDVVQDLNEYFIPDVHFVEFDESDFETKLLTLLESKEKRRLIQKTSLQYLNKDFSLEAIHSQILERVLQDKKNEIVADRKNEFEALLAWMHTLSTSPVHHRFKREIFAKMAISSGIDDPLAIRYTVMALPILVNVEHGNTFIFDSALRDAFEESLASAVGILYSKLNAVRETTILDQWFYLCTKCLCNEAEKPEIEKLCDKIESTFEDTHFDLKSLTMVLLDLDISSNEFVTLKKELFDIPTMTYIANKKERVGITKRYLINVLKYFSDQL